ncbi:hypothetical protein ACAX46_004363 [Providencia rettgeri]
MGEIVDQLVTGKSQEEKYEDAKKQLKQLTDEFKKKNCAGLSADACSAKMVEHRNELLMGATDFGIDFVPVVGDIKGFAEAQSAIDYLAATVGLIPVLGDGAGKYIKLADKALKEGDIAEASRLINKASDEITAKMPSNPTSQSSSGVWKPNEVENSAGINVGSGKQKDDQIWTETKKTDPVSNAYGHWDKHKKEFPEFQNSKQYVDATHNFVSNPPKGTLIKTRPNGDTMYYNPSTNTFAVKNADGTPKTMFRPENGMEYWERQK